MKFFQWFTTLTFLTIKNKLTKIYREKGKINKNNKNKIFYSQQIIREKTTTLEKKEIPHKISWSTIQRVLPKKGIFHKHEKNSSVHFLPVAFRNFSFRFFTFFGTLVLRRSCFSLRTSSLRARRVAGDSPRTRKCRWWAARFWSRLSGGTLVCSSPELPSSSGPDPDSLVASAEWMGDVVPLPMLFKLQCEIWDDKKWGWHDLKKIIRNNFF